MTQNRILLAIALLFSFPIAAFAQSTGNYKYRNSNQLDQQYQQQAPSFNSNVYQQEAGFGEFRDNRGPSGTTATYLSDSVIVLTASIMKNSLADEHVAIFALSQVGTTVEEANTLMEETFNKCIAELEKIGVTRNQVFIDMISLQPKYEVEITKKTFSKTAKEVPKGFTLKKNLHIRYTNDQMFNQIVLAASRAEIFDLVKVDYFVKDIDGINRELRLKAAEVIKEKAKVYADLGVVFDSTYQPMLVETMNSFYPAERYYEYTVEGSTAMEALNKKGLTSVTSVEREKTEFYHKVPYNRYDAVLNPVVFQPSVQFTLHLQVRYTLKRRIKALPPRPVVQPAPKPEYYILQPDLKVVVPMKESK